MPELIVSILLSSISNDFVSVCSNSYQEFSFHKFLIRQIESSENSWDIEIILFLSIPLHAGNFIKENCRLLIFFKINV